MNRMRSAVRRTTPPAQQRARRWSRKPTHNQASIASVAAVAATALSGRSRVLATAFAATAWLLPSIVRETALLIGCATLDPANEGDDHSSIGGFRTGTDPELTCFGAEHAATMLTWPFLFLIGSTGFVAITALKQLRRYRRDPNDVKVNLLYGTWFAGLRSKAAWWRPLLLSMQLGAVMSIVLTRPLGGLGQASTAHVFAIARLAIASIVRPYAARGSNSLEISAASAMVATCDNRSCHDFCVAAHGKPISAGVFTGGSVRVSGIASNVLCPCVGPANSAGIASKIAQPYSESGRIPGTPGCVKHEVSSVGMKLV